jgi:hypothetical protein
MPVAISLRRVAVASLLISLALMPALLVASRSIVFAGSGSGPIAADWPCSGTKFFNSAGVGTIFHVGDSWAGGTFSAIENNNYMEVRDNPESGAEGYIVGEFNSPKLNGGVATISFASPIHITSVYVWDNDPDTLAGETGWSFNGVALPITGQHTAQIVSKDILTSTVTIDAGDDSGGVDFCIDGEAFSGHTPGFWKNHLSAWVGYSPSAPVSSVFSGANPNQAGKTLLQALQFGGGPGVDGAEQILLRAAVSALLNSTSSLVNYPLTTAQVISQVSAALATDNRATILALATTLDNYNNL